MTVTGHPALGVAAFVLAALAFGTLLIGLAGLLLEGREAWRDGTVRRAFVAAAVLAFAVALLMALT